MPQRSATSLVGAATRARSPCAVGLIAAVSTWGWIGAARDASPDRTSSGAYVAATLGVSVPSLMSLTDRFAVSPDGTAMAIVDGDRGGLLLRRTSVWS